VRLLDNAPRRQMMEIMSIDNSKLKDLFKQAIVEAIEEKKEVVHDLFMEAMEDLAMVRAIEEGESSGTASRKEIFDILDGKEGSA
jgi:spore coat polysaccharide biosynthesis protein SpsF (cytidylyltransferase family)